MELPHPQHRCFRNPNRWRSSLPSVLLYRPDRGNLVGNSSTCGGGRVPQEGSDLRRPSPPGSLGESSLTHPPAVDRAGCPSQPPPSACLPACRPVCLTALVSSPAVWWLLRCLFVCLFPLLFEFDNLCLAEINTVPAVRGLQRVSVAVHNCHIPSSSDLNNTWETPNHRRASLGHHRPAASLLRERRTETYPSSKHGGGIYVCGQGGGGWEGGEGRRFDNNNNEKH